MNDIVNKKDTNGLYQYIINNINNKNIKVLWKALREYTENGTYQEELYNKKNVSYFNNYFRNKRSSCKYFK